MWSTAPTCWRSAASGSPAPRPSSRATTSSVRRTWACSAGSAGLELWSWIDQMDIYLLEAVINGILLGGVLALLALGLNLIFGVIDVVWIAYADLVMCGMYVIFWLYVELGWPLQLAC